MSIEEKFKEYGYSKAPNKENQSDKEEVVKYGYGVRHIQLIIFTLCLIVNFISRGHMGVTIVAMTNNHKGYTETLNGTVGAIKLNDTNHLFNRTVIEHSVVTINKTGDIVKSDDTSENIAQTYDWPKSTQEIVLSSFFAGYTIMMFPMGIICQRWGGKLPLQIALFVNGIVSILAPWLTTWGGWKAVSFCRLLQGLSQAGTYPSLQSLLATWVPVSERATLTSYVYTGSSFGNIIAFQVGGILAETSYGWRSTFWTVGVMSLISFGILSVFGTASPMEHKTISQKEKHFILGTIKERAAEKPKVPWKALLKSKPVWGVIITHIGCGTTYVFYFIQVPSYIHNILGISVLKSGVLTSLPYIASLFFSLAFGWISDYCTNNKLVSVRNARRISNTISQLGIAMTLVCVSYTRNTAVAVACLVAAMIFQAAAHTGWMINHMDLAPNFSGMLMAVGNTLANLASMSLTTLVTFVITDMTNVIQWRIMFFIVAGLCTVTNVIFVLLMSSDVQPWNYAHYNESCIEDLKIEKTKQEKE